MSLKSKLALITGSTSGIGLGVAQALAKAGSNLVINGFGKEIDVLCKKLANDYNVEVAYDGADMSKYGDIDSMMKKFDVDILVNNAGNENAN